MRTSAPTCFISYCHQDIDRNLLDYFFFVLREVMKDNVNIVYDNNLRPGENIDKFMDNTLDVDVAILILTPSYKSKISRRQGGVYKEFTNIVTRYWEQEKESTDTIKNQSHRFQVIPILLSGDPTDSVPESIANLLYVDLTGLTVMRDKKSNKLVVSDHIRTKFVPEIRKIADQLLIVATMKGNKYLELMQQFYNDLFVILKASEGHHDKVPNFISDVFVPTVSFTRGQSQLSYFLIGRKGSGKSTITSALPVVDLQRYNGIIKISANNIDLNSAYSSLNQATLSDIESTIPKFSFFEYSWQGFLCLLIMDLLMCRCEDDRLTTQQAMHMAPINIYLMDFQSNHPPDKLQDAMFSFAVNKLQEFWNRCIQDARHTKGDSQFIADIKLAFNQQEYLAFLLGKDTLNALSEVIKNCQKRVLVTLDDFDTIFDTFRRTAKPAEELDRARFELDWLRSLMLLILDIKDLNGQDKPFFRTLDFCVTIPKDRYAEIERTDRDGYRYNTRTCHILWSGIELCHVLRRRLEKTTGVHSEDTLPAHERLYQVCEKYKQFRYLPAEVIFMFNGKQVNTPLFSYVLRHTFWRPRDILLYYASLLAAVFSMEKPSGKISATIIKRIISETTHQIIRTEFIDEYETTFKNIRDVIGRFTGASQVMGYQELEDRLLDIRFALSAFENVNMNMQDKIEFLYDIGFLGIVLPDQQRQALNIACKEAFYFNEGGSALRAAKRQKFTNVSFAIHPIFTERLQLDYSQNDFLLNLSWDYLYDNHTIQAAAANQF